MLYILYYEKKGDCYERIQHYHLSAHIWDMSKKLITQKIPSGRLIAVQQFHCSGQPVLTMTNYTAFEVLQWIPFIVQPGKRYYFAVNNGIREIPAEYPMTSETDSGKLFNKFAQSPQPNRDARKRSPHLIDVS